jgi:hypothetical protein
MKLLIALMIVYGAVWAEFTRDDVHGIVADSTTDLMWQDHERLGHENWQDAIDYCEDLTLGGYSDWRLPNINELQTIVDRSLDGSALVRTFDHPPFARLWSSTTYSGDFSRALYVDVSVSGKIGSAGKVYVPSGVGANVGQHTCCVRGGD